MSFDIRRMTRLSDCASFQEGYVNPSQKYPSYFGDEVKWLRATDLNDGFVFETSRRLSKKGFESAGKSATLFAPESLAISKSGTIGRIGIIKDYMCGNRAVINIKPNRSCDTRFIFYTLLLNRQKIETLAEGSVQKNLYVSALGSLEIELPSLVEQIQISSVLGALDDRIALLRETNTTLEAIAQALFKSWFVDFDPVRAKQQGREPEGMDAATAALFPDSFEESELGLVPRGWRVGPILDIARLLSGGTPKTDRPEYWGGGIAWASAKDVSQSGDSLLVETDRTITLRGLEESATRMIPALSSVVVARGATTGRMVLLGNAMAMNQTCYALESKTATPIALYCQLRREIDALVNAAHGSVFDTITTSTFAQSKVLQPFQPLLKHFEDLAAPLFQKILVGTRASRTLAALRDTLLPRLISGQLRLPEAETQMTRAAA